ncbi:MAG: TolC family protein [Methylovirgula sp.]
MNHGMQKFWQSALIFATSLLTILSLGPATAAKAISQHRHTRTLNLVAFVQYVLTRNPDIKVQESGHNAAVARIASAGALDDPIVSYAPAPLTMGSSLGYGQMAQLSQAVPWPGTLDLRVQAATAQAKAAEYQVIDARLRQASQARATYADWYYVYQALAINKQTIKLVEHLKSVAEAAYSSGQAPQQDVLQAEVELTRLRNQSLELERRRLTVQAAINTLLDVDPSTPVDPPGNLPRPTFGRSIKELTAAALAQYPGLMSADAEVAAGDDRVELAKKAFYPNFNFIAGVNTLMNDPRQQLTVGVAINIPISGRHSGELDEAHANLSQSEAKLDALRGQLLNKLKQTYAAINQISHTINLYNKQLVPLATLNLKAAEADYSAGTGDFLKLITAEQQYLLIKLERERAYADYFTQFAALDYQTGGVIFGDN